MPSETARGPETKHPRAPTAVKAMRPTTADVRTTEERRGIAQPPPPPRAPFRRQQQQPMATEAPMHSNEPTTAPTRGTMRPQTAATAPTATTHTNTLFDPVAPPTTDTTRVLLTTRAAAPTEATRGPSTLVADANPPTERGTALRGKRRRNRAPRPVRSEPAAASTPHPRQTRTAPAQTHPATSSAMHVPTTTDTPAANMEQTQMQRIPPPTGQAPVLRATRSTATSQLPAPPNQPPPIVPSAEQRAQGEAQTNPDIMAIVRVVVEALMTGITAYLQGQGAIPALTAGLTVLTRLHSY